MDQKENTERCELKVAQKLLAALPALDGKTVTADPLHCQKETARIIIEKGGEYFLQIKGNQPALLKAAQRASRGSSCSPTHRPPLFPSASSPLLSRPVAGTGESKSAP